MKLPELRLEMHRTRTARLDLIEASILLQWLASQLQLSQSSVFFCSRRRFAAVEQRGALFLVGDLSVRLYLWSKFLGGRVALLRFVLL